MMGTCLVQETERHRAAKYTREREREETTNGPAKGTHYASVTSHGVDRIKMHLRVSLYVEHAPLNSFLDTLRAFLKQKM